MIPLKDFFVIDSLQYLLENFDSISKEDIEKAIKEKKEKEFKNIKKFENKIILIQEYENFIQIYKFDSFDSELGEITYDKISFVLHNTSFECTYSKNHFVKNISEFRFNPKDYRELTKEEYKKYIKFYNETKENLNKTIFKNEQ